MPFSEKYEKREITAKIMIPTKTNDFRVSQYKM